MAAGTIDEPLLHRRAANGVDQAFFEWRPERRRHGPSVLLVHATGFHGRVWDQVVHRLPGRHVLAVVFRPQAPRDYCEHGLRPADDGSGWQLACHPAFEGKVYPLGRQNLGVYASIRALLVPVLVVRARAGDPAILPWAPLGSPTWPRHGRDLHLPDKTHMLPMEDPALVARLIDAAVRHGAAA